MKSKNIFQINGHSINFLKKEVIIFKLNSTWGWATWRRAWKSDLKMSGYKKMKKKNLIKEIL